MKYQEARPDMRTGDLLATAELGIVSRIIRRLTKSAASHVAGVIELNQGGMRRLYVIESHRKSGVVLVALSQWISRCRGPVWWWPACLPDQASRGRYAERVMARLGDKYESDKWMLTRVALGMKPPANHRWFCSELDLAGRAAAGVRLDGVGPGRWPEDCLQLYGGVANATRLAK